MLLKKGHYILKKRLMSHKKTYPGINIQWPISRDILSGKKTIETRTYPIPEKYLGEEMLLIETPGPYGDFKARIIAIIIFTECFKYPSMKVFYSDYPFHLINKKSPWAWKEKAKWGWRVNITKVISPPINFPEKKGIVYTRGITFS